MMRRPNWRQGIGLAHGLTALALLALAGCGSVPGVRAPEGGAVRTPGRPEAGVPALPPAGSGRGGYYKDDGPGDNPPPNLLEVPDAQPRVEPYLPRANRPYVVFGKTYTPMTDNQPFTQRGVGSWYGKKFHGQRTSSGELYDMYKMTAAHPTLPIPSYARLTSIVSGKQVVVRVNDRGPFHSSRAIDVSYTAALKLGLLGKGSHEILIERLLPADIARMASGKPQPAQIAVADVEPVTGGVVMPEATVTLLPTAMAATPVSSGSSAPVAAKGGFYLQLGAFGRAENAEAERTRLTPQAATLGALEVVQAGTVYRLYGGPFGSRGEAGQAARDLGMKAIIVQR